MTHQPYTTNYPARDLARLAYAQWLSRHGANEKIKSGDTIPAEPKPNAVRGKAALAAQLRDAL